MIHLPYLSTLIWLPILGAIVVLFLGGDKNAHLSRMVALGIAIISLLICCLLWADFSYTNAGYQFQENVSWIPAYGINYALGVDGISMPMVILSTITTLVVVLASWHSIKRHVAQYLATFLVMQGMMVGVFSAVDSILFYVFWEAMLIPIYLNIGIWGGDNRVYASVKFFIYTFAGSALMLVAILYLRVHAHSFMIPDFYALRLTRPVQDLIFIAFLLAFAVKVPMWPVHTWLPDAHTEAPAGGSVVLAALMLKLGIYGFLRFNLPITPDTGQAIIWGMIVLALIAIVYIGIIAIMQKDMKRLIAYSSISHMGFAVLGTFMVYIIVAKTGNMKDAYLSLEGAMIQMISHAFSTGALFIGIGILYDRIHSRMIHDYGGVAHKLPVFAALMMVFALSNVGLPGTSGFVGEFMIILSAFKASFWVAFLAASTLILGAAYTLWMYKRVFFGKITSEKIENIEPLHFPELLALFILAAIVIVMGVYPLPVLDIFHASVGQILHESLMSKIPV
jgi:NADH-quinone oxidoreductase subunit M